MSEARTFKPSVSVDGREFKVDQFFSFLQSPGLCMVSIGRLLSG